MYAVIYESNLLKARCRAMFETEQQAQDYIDYKTHLTEKFFREQEARLINDPDNVPMTEFEIQEIVYEYRQSYSIKCIQGTFKQDK